jgi:hypothetical protein
MSDSASVLHERRAVLYLALCTHLRAHHAAEALVAENVRVWAAAGDDLVRREFVGAEAASCGGCCGHRSWRLSGGGLGARGHSSWPRDGRIVKAQASFGRNLQAAAHGGDGDKGT